MTAPVAFPILKKVELDNLVVTAHMGSYAAEARTAMELEAARLLLHGLEKADFT